MTFDAYAPFVPPQFGIMVARDRFEYAGALALRRLVFCEEQRLFDRDDRDDDDERATTIVAVDYIMGMAHRVVGTVRIVETAVGAWYGSRLAIAPDYRNFYGLGSGLVHRAVTTAHGRGAGSFHAHVQRRNVAFFERLPWTALECEMRFGQPHTLMQANLEAYPPAGASAPTAFLHTRRAS